MAYDGDIAMRAKTNTSELIGSKPRRAFDPALKRALSRAMKGALRRSVVLLPGSEDEDRLQTCLAGLLGVTA